AEPDAAGLAGDGPQRHPRVRGSRRAVAAADAQVVIRAEEAVEATRFCGAGDGELLLVARTLLGLDHDPQVHGGAVYGRPRIGTGGRSAASEPIRRRHRSVPPTGPGALASAVAVREPRRWRSP